MRWEEWKPTYLEIAALLKLDQQSDWKATELLTYLLRNTSPEPLISKLSELIRNHIIVVCGAGPSLESHLIAAKFNPNFEDAVYIAADGATSAFVELGYNCDIIVTDLDGDLDKIKHAVTCGALPVVHSHGDNMNIIKEVVPTLPNVLGSTQVEPTERAFLWGGFTDGDIWQNTMHQNRLCLQAWILGKQLVVGQNQTNQIASLLMKRKRRNLRLQRSLFDNSCIKAISSTSS
jgi:uncharacterized Rossmann fold enzyme